MNDERQQSATEHSYVGHDRVAALNHLHRPLTAGDLQRKLDVARPTAYRIVRELYAAGLVEKAGEKPSGDVSATLWLRTTNSLLDGDHTEHRQPGGEYRTRSSARSP